MLSWTFIYLLFIPLLIFLETLFKNFFSSSLFNVLHLSSHIYVFSSFHISFTISYFPFYHLRTSLSILILCYPSFTPIFPLKLQKKCMSSWIHCIIHYLYDDIVIISLNIPPASFFQIFEWVIERHGKIPDLIRDVFSVLENLISWFVYLFVHEALRFLIMRY